MAQRWALSFVVTTAVVGANLAFVPSAQAAPVSASSTIVAAMPSRCAKKGQIQTRWSTSKKKYKLVAWTTVTIPAHTTYRRTETLTRTGSVTASVTTSAEVSAKFKTTVLTSLEAKLGIQLQNLGQSTNQFQLTDEFSVAARSRQSRFVFFKGVKHATGSWKARKCVSMKDEGTFWEGWKKGKAGSWDGEHKGAIDCATSQTSGSIEAVAKAAGC